MKSVLTLLAFLFLLDFTVSAQSRTPNIGFEDGTFTNWQCYSGMIDGAGNISVSETGPINGLFSIYGKESAQILDPYGHFPVQCPNGSKYSVKINDDSKNKKAERVSYTFQTPSAGPYSIIFNYAIVLDNPNHSDYQQPRFTAVVYDVTDGTEIECPKFNFVGGSPIGLKTSDIPGPSHESISYRPWSTATIDLRGYLGKTIRLEFTVNDCTLGGHFGYAYLDVEDSDSISPITGNAYCIGQNTVNLVGPTGFSQYEWYTADLKTKFTQEKQDLTISPPPPDKTTYALVVHPFDGLGCTDTLYTTVNKINAGFVFKARDTVYGCLGSTFDLTSAAVVAGSDADLTYSYYTDSIATVYAYNPDLLTEGGQFYIKAVNKGGCTGILPVYVQFELPTLHVTTPATVQYPATVDLTKTFVHQGHFTYSYYTDTTAKTPIANPTAIGVAGTYYVRIGDVNGCNSWYPIQVTITPPDPFILNAPNAFTPNGDGINDLYQMAIHGYLDFGNVKIFNRNGQLLFTSKSIDQHWDGTYGGKQVPDGVYYWIFEGTDSYYHVSVTRSGSVTVIR
jgi:gliding motility-associated-like protein